MLGERIGRPLPRRRLQIVRIHLARNRLPFLSNAPIMIDAEVPADADNPRLKIRPSIERIQRLEDLEKDILRQIFRFVVLADELVRDVEHLSPVQANNRVPGDLIAAQALLDEAVGRARLRGGGVNRHATASESYQTVMPPELNWRIH